MTPFELIISFILIGSSVFLSSTEVALFSLSRFQLRQLRENFSTAHRKIKRMLSDSAGILTTILITNEVVNIAFSTIVANIVTRNWDENATSEISFLPIWAQQTFVGLLITTPILLFICEITPKVIGAKINRIIAPMSSAPMYFLYQSSYPIRKFVELLITILTNKKPDSSKKKEPLLKEDEFLIMLEEGQKEGTIQENEFQLVKNVFSLDDTSAAEVMTPIHQLLSISKKAKLKQVLETVKQRKIYRIPVYGKTRDDIVGIFFTKDLLQASLDPEKLDDTVSQHMRKAYYVLPSMRVSRLFRYMKTNKTHVAIVETLDEKSIGLVTVDDILDEVFENYFQETRRKKV